MTHDRSPDTTRLGATPLGNGRTHFRVWAPDRQRVDVEVFTAERVTTHALGRTDDGYFTGVAPVGAGALYKFRLDDQLSRPDPASRFQPQGVHGPSEVVDPLCFRWSDESWQGVAKRDLVIYELHVGAFTQEGAFLSAIERLPELVELGVTAVELMPVAQSPGEFNWGYDGVNLYAVRNTYGRPDDLRSLVDACHAHGLAVLLDVVYNHVGPEGNYLSDFGPYASKRHHTPWGDAFNFDGRRRLPVRRFVVENAVGWLKEYHLDGLRLDAAHFMHDQSEAPILHEVRQAVHDFERQAGRKIHLIAEANVYDPQLLAPTSDATAYDAIWCDCLMHALYSHAAPTTKLTGREYRGAEDVAEALAHGYLYFNADHQRATSSHRAEFHERDDRSHLASLVIALQTHDAVGNHPHGLRLHDLTSREFQRAAAALVLLYPSIPLIFMGEESAALTPFPFFADFEDRRLRRAVNKGRAREYPSDTHQTAPRPTRESTFLAAKCDKPEVQDQDMLEWYRSLLALRKEGIAAGWLAADNFSTEWDRSRELFTLRYQCVDGGQIAVCVRLAKSDKTVLASLPGHELLSSERVDQHGNGQVALHPNHAVVVQQP